MIGWRSTDPISHSPPAGIGRDTPRWSVGGQRAGLILSNAGLPALGSRVRVGPPLFASGPSCTLATARPGQVPSLFRLFPPLMMVPAQLPALFSATIEFARRTLPALCASPRPVLPAM